MSGWRQRQRTSFLKTFSLSELVLEKILPSRFACCCLYTPSSEMSYGRSQSSREQKKMQTVTLVSVRGSPEDRGIYSQRHDGYYNNRSMKRAADTLIPEATASIVIGETRGLLGCDHQACNAGSKPESHSKPQDVGTACMQYGFLGAETNDPVVLPSCQAMKGHKWDCEKGLLTYSGQ